MQQYYKPDLDSLRPVPEAERRAIFGLDEEQPETAPDLLLVQQLLGMIRYARETGASPASCAA